MCRCALPGSQGRKRWNYGNHNHVISKCKVSAVLLAVFHVSVTYPFPCDLLPSFLYHQAPAPNPPLELKSGYTFYMSQKTGGDKLFQEGVFTIFKELDNLRDRLQMLSKPNGTSANPARNCYDLFLHFPSFTEGELEVETDSICSMFFFVKNYSILPFWGVLWSHKWPAHLCTPQPHKLLFETHTSSAVVFFVVNN